MKTLLNIDGADVLMTRTKMLQQNTMPLWGSMNVSEMLHHCNKATEAILEGVPTFKKSTLKQRILKLLFLHVVKKLPKNANAPDRFNVKKNQLQTGGFEIEQQEFLKLIERFAQHQQPINLSHPVFGKLNTKEWGMFSWMHLDHHLRQFGV